VTAVALDAPGALHFTRRDPAAVSLGGRAAVVADALGTPLMPWQRYVADVALELDPDAPARWRYPVVVVTVPRQSGKTTLMRAVAVDRALSKADQLIFTTAQTGKDAGERWKDLADQVMRSPLRTRTKMYRGAGAQSIILPNRSRVRAFAPTPTSIHGYTPHLVMIDEAWAFDEARGDELIAAINPAQITLPDRQLWIVSTKGDQDSAFLDRYLDIGRLAVGDPNASVAYFEWAAAADAPPYDPATLDFHPAVGHTITQDDLLAQADAVSRGVWERAFLNRATASSESILDLDLWDALAVEQTPPDLAGVSFGYDVAHDSSAASIWAAWRNAAGTLQLREYTTGPGVRWLVETLVELRATARPRLPFAADDGGPARQVTDELRRLNVPVETLSARDYATASSTLLRLARERQLEHDGSEGIREAWRVAAMKPLAGQLAFDPAKSAGPIDHLRAAAVAARGLDHAAPSAGKPVIYS
jgi:hypothetical protein